jgi:hypothetical protein
MMPDEVTRKMEEIFMKLDVGEYLRRLIPPNEDILPDAPKDIPNPFIDIESYRQFIARADCHEFRQEYLGDFVEPEREPPKNTSGRRPYQGEANA